ncbi:twin-arginine translocase TatA/TatE family subunit [Halalkalicoccus subterraneus]|uniref:twin-arginine translocase TatA/TatE family subunit n=1 Tax=Halalkalicoccus subterraneus TaxID=2675002 RepID=UPI000EFC18D5|nr:twin-arginine translocase TatA/TatE family subunit [Halalkalicoccus subterraneus]
MTVQFAPLFGPIPGGIELAVIVLIAILLFGANKIPKLARSTGQAMGEFQKGREEIDQELQEMRDGATGSTDNEPEPDIGTDDDLNTDESTTTTTATETDSGTETDSRTGTDSGTEAELETDENR